MSNLLSVIYQLMCIIVFIFLYLGGLIALALSITVVSIYIVEVILFIQNRIKSAIIKRRFKMYKIRYVMLVSITKQDYAKFSMCSRNIIRIIKNATLCRYTKHCFYDEEKSIVVSRNAVMIDSKVWMPDDEVELSKVMTYLKRNVFDK